MLTATPRVEAARLAALHAYDVLDTAPEPGFDDLVANAALVAGVPTSLISLVAEDRQWFKARVGLALRETPREVAFCDLVVTTASEVEVADARADERFAHNPLVTGPPHICFYAGFPLHSAGGHVIGTLNVIDDVPRVLDDRQRAVLRCLARQVVAQLDLSVALRAQEAAAAQLAEERAASVRAERFLAGLLDALHVAVVACDAHGSVSVCNTAAAELLGDATGRLDPHDLPLAAALAGERIDGDLVHVARPGHAERTVRCHGARMVGADGAVAGAVVVAADLTTEIDLRHALESANSKIRTAFKGLAVTRRRLEQAQEMAGLGSWSWDAGTGAVQWSERLRRMFDLDEDAEPVIATLARQVHPDDRGVVDAAWRAAVSGGPPDAVEHRVLWRDGTVRWLRAWYAAEADDDGRVVRLTGSAQDVTDERGREDELRAAAMVDPLTKLANRRGWASLAPLRLAGACDAGIPTTVAVLDLDHFKAVNDERGHAAGDELLRSCAEQWRARLRKGDLVARIGGDEFTLLMPGCGLDEARRLVDQLRLAAPRPVTVSAGLSVVEPGEALTAALERADAALRAAKEAGRDRVAMM